MEYGQLYIIPDENKLMETVFHKKIMGSHLDEIQEFSNQYGLGYRFNKEEFQDAPCLLACDGHLIVKTVDDAGIMICYIPEVVTDYQYMWFYNQVGFLDRYTTICAYSLKKDKDTYQVDEVYGRDSVMHTLSKRNILYHHFKKENLNGKLR